MEARSRVDEKTAIQALYRLDPVLRVAWTSGATRFEYYRHGT